MEPLIPALPSATSFSPTLSISCSHRRLPCGQPSPPSSLTAGQGVWLYVCLPSPPFPLPPLPSPSSPLFTFLLPTSLPLVSPHPVSLLTLLPTSPPFSLFSSSAAPPPPLLTASSFLPWGEKGVGGMPMESSHCTHSSKVSFPGQVLDKDPFGHFPSKGRSS